MVRQFEFGRDLLMRQAAFLLQCLHLLIVDNDFITTTKTTYTMYPYEEKKERIYETRFIKDGVADMAR